MGSKVDHGRRHRVSFSVRYYATGLLEDVSAPFDTTDAHLMVVLSVVICILSVCILEP